MKFFVSSSCSQEKQIGSAVRSLAKLGFNQIELSGGTEWYEDWKSELLELQKEFGLTYQVHNYFPPPADHFLLNLSTVDPEVLAQSQKHLKLALELCLEWDIPIYSLHAGFDSRISHHGLGTALEIHSPQNSLISQNFYRNLQVISDQYPCQIYVENHCLIPNKNCNNPLMMVHPSEIQEHIDRGGHLLFDLAHFHVSARTLGLDFETHALNFVRQSNYLHISDNDGSSDANLALQSQSPISRVLAQSDLTNKRITLEIYGDDEGLLLTQQWLLNQKFKGEP